MLATVPTHTSAPGEIAAYARPYWNMATGLGTPNATTSFHNDYDKRDIHRVRGRNDRYTGARAMSIGYMKGGVKMMKFLTSDEGRSLVGVDCSKPGSGGQARQDRIRSVGDDFLALAAYYSKRREYERGDIEAVAEARDLEPDKFATFVGFSHAIVSPEFHALRHKWLADEQAELVGPQPQVAPVSQATPLAVVVGVEVPPAAAAPAPAATPEHPPRDPRVVDMDNSEDEEEEELPAAPPPPPPAPPPPLPAYNEQTHQIFKLMIKVLLRDPVTEERAKPELRDLANTIDGMSYPAHMRRVQQLIGAPRLGEIMRALEAGAAAPAAAPVEKQDSEAVLNRKIFGNDDDDAASDRSVSPVTMPDEVVDGLPDMYEERKRLEAEQRREAVAAAALAAAKPASRRTVKFAAGPASTKAVPKPLPKPIPKPTVPAAKPQAKATKRSAPPNMQPAQGPRKKQAPSPAANPAAEAATEGVNLKALGREILAAYEAAKATYKTNRYDAENTPILNAQASLYHIETKRRKDGKSAGQQDTDVLFALHSPLHKILKKTKLRSLPDIKRAFDLP